MEERRKYRPKGLTDCELHGPSPSRRAGKYVNNKIREMCPGYAQRRRRPLVPTFLGFPSLRPLLDRFLLLPTTLTRVTDNCTRDRAVNVPPTAVTGASTVCGYSAGRAVPKV